MSIVISLCDLTGAMVEPWVEAGYEAMLVDPQHVVTREEGPVLKFAGTVRDALPTIGEMIRAGRVAAVFGFPPCTHLASSGARWWSDKRAADYMFQAKAASVAEQCRTVGELSGAPWMVENPKGALARVFGKTGKHLIEPYWFTAFEPADNYTKETYLWVGGGFRVPLKHRDLTLGPPDDRIHKAPPGPERENFRSATPRGFARAVFEANAHRAVAA